MPFREDWRLTGIGAAKALIKRLDRPPFPNAFGGRLLEITKRFNVDTVMVGAIPSMCCAGSPHCCTEVEQAPLPPPPGKWAARQPEQLVPSETETHVFMRGDDSEVLSYRIGADEHAGIEWGPGKGLLFPTIATGGALHGLAFFGASLSMDEESRRMLGFISHYSLGRALRSSSGVPALSRRQLETLQWAAEGKTDQEIATILGISEHTVDKYMRQSREALNAVNRTAIIVQAMRLGLIA